MSILAEQASGGNVVLAWKKELTPGVPNFSLTGGGLDTTLAEAVQPGASEIEVVDATGAAAGDILRAGDDVNPMYLVIDSSYVSGTTIPIDTDKTFIMFRLEAGEVVQEVTPAGLKRMPAFATIDAQGEVGKIISAAISGDRGTARSRRGNVSVEFSTSFEMGIEHVAEWFVYAITQRYSVVGTPKSGGLDTTLDGAHAAGDTTIELTAITNLNAGDLVQVDADDNAEVVKIDAGWNGSDNPVPLDAATPLRFDHETGVDVVEVETANFTMTAKRGPTIGAMSMFLFSIDTDMVTLIKGAKINTIATTFNPDENTISIQLGIIAQSIQILEENIFGVPQALAHSFYAPWEGKVKQDDIVLGYVESLSCNFNNDIPSNAQRTLGSPFRRRVTIGKGTCDGSLTYQLVDASRIKDQALGTRRKLGMYFVYTEDDNHALDIEFPRASFTGPLGPGVTDTGPRTVQQNFDGETDETIKSDMVLRIKSPQYVLD